MKKSFIYIVWAVLYCACVGFSFVGNLTAGEETFLLALSMGFFVPPFYLAYQAKKEENRKALRALRLISLSVVVLTTLLLVLNFLSVYFSTQAGLALYVLLAIFSAPMLCSQYWFVSLFFWACLLMLTGQKRCPCQT